MKVDNTFYSDLAIHKFEANSIFADPSTFTSLPPSWYVLCTDVENSTRSYQEGRWRVVNKIAAAGIDLILSVATKHNIEIPYVYGGDGILACFPPELLKEISNELIFLYKFGHTVCGMNLRIGIIPVADIIQAGFDFRIKRVGNTGAISHTLFDDSAFAWIDNAIKNDSEYSLVSIITETAIDELTYDNFVLPVWEPVTKFDPDEIFLCTIIRTQLLGDERIALYNTILNMLYSRAPRFFRNHPIISMEDDEVFSLDFIKTDGMFKIILSTDSQTITDILQELELLVSQGLITYGHVVSEDSVITYIIKESEDYSAGLLDLADGGYVAAAQILKSKLSSAEK